MEDLLATALGADAFEEARRVRDRREGLVTFSRNVFVPLSRRCRNRCSYCHFRRDSGDAMTLGEVEGVLRRGVVEGCSEALFTFGEAPWEVSGSREFFLKYLREALQISIECDLVPHTNPGVVPLDFLAEVAGLNGSMGVMLESTAELEVHREAPGKVPKRRLVFLDEAMSLGVPFTSGILVGVGESWRDRLEALAALRDLQVRHGTLQEVIVQNLRPPEGSGMESPSRDVFLRTVALARLVFPDVSVQAPPNLAEPGELLDAGIDDFGGVSPVTEDHVNPGAEWPGVAELEEACRERGLELRERLAIHPVFVREGRFPEAVAGVVEELSDSEGFRRQS